MKRKYSYLRKNIRTLIFSVSVIILIQLSISNIILNTKSENFNNDTFASQNETTTPIHSGEEEIALYFDIVFEYYFVSQAVFKGGIVTINITLLSISNTSIFFEYKPSHMNVEWSPEPQNQTLNPGESFEGTFTLEKGGSDGIGQIDYIAKLPEGTNATVYWSWKIWNTGNSLSAMNYLFTIGTILMVTVSLTIYRRQKK